MTSLLLLFGCTFVVVFALGLQSLNVNQGHHWAATFTSLLISASSIFLYQVMPSANWLEIAAYVLGAVAGINTSMWFHRRAKDWLQLQLARWKTRRAVSRRPDEHCDVRYCGGFKALDVTARRDTDMH